MLWRRQWSIDAGSGTAVVIQRTFVSQESARLCPLIEVGVFGLDAMARELTPCGGGIAAPTFGFHRERGVTLKGATRARLE